MNISLISLPIVEGDPKANIAKMESLFCNALERHKPELVCFPEMSVVTDGYPWGRYRHLAEPIPGKYSDFFCSLAKKHQVHIALGLMESEAENHYSTAILIDLRGKIQIKHRQVRNGGPYACGDTFNISQVAFGTVMFAICADIWADDLVSCIENYKPEYIIVPEDMCGNDDELGLINCDRPPDELVKLKEQYIKISKLAGSKVLAVNCYCKDTEKDCAAFGGAFIFDNGKELPPIGSQESQWRQPVDQPIYNFII